MSGTVSALQMKLTPSQTRLAMFVMRKTQVSFYVHGAPGISKSAVARQVADELGIAFIDFRLTSVAPEDIRGIPDLVDVGGMKGLIWTPPIVFPRDLALEETIEINKSKLIRFYNPKGDNNIYYCKNPEIKVSSLELNKTAEIIEKSLNSFVVVIKDENGELTTGKILWTVTGLSEAILGLEEFNSAEPAVMAAAYQLILDRRIGEYLVPDGVMILALGNRDGDKGVTFKIPKPVANRFVHVEMVVDFPDWQLWAIKSMISSTVVGYLTKFPGDLFDEKFAEKPDHSFYTPRSWEFVSKIIDNADGAMAIVIKTLICGAIGTVVGNKFISHRAFMADMPDPLLILDGTVTTFTVKDLQYKAQIAYSTCIQLCYELQRELKPLKLNIIFQVKQRMLFTKRQKTVQREKIGWNGPIVLLDFP